MFVRQVAAAHHLRTVTKKKVEGRAKLGVEAFAEALLGIPKILAENSGYDAQVSPAAPCSPGLVSHTQQEDRWWFMSCAVNSQCSHSECNDWLDWHSLQTRSDLAGSFLRQVVGFFRQCTASCRPHACISLKRHTSIAHEVAPALHACTLCRERGQQHHEGSSADASGKASTPAVDSLHALGHLDSHIQHHTPGHLLLDEKPRGLDIHLIPS